MNVLFSLCVLLLAMAISYGQVRDTYSDTWVATDELGRAVSDNSTVGNPQANRTVGLFYYIWLNETPGWPVKDISKILAGQDTWGGAPSFHHYGESLYGYYSSKDDFVIRKHMQMFADAGVDFIFLDNTNGAIYQDVQENLFNVLLDMRTKGLKIPKVSWAMYNGNMNAEIELLYDNIATNPTYQSLFFQWQGKTLLLGQYSGGRSEVANFFTFKKSWAWTSQPWYTETGGRNRWPWLDNYPQAPGLDGAGNVEQITVTAAQHPHGQYAIGKSTGANITQTPVYGTDGKYFELQWQRALQVDPPLVMVTQWNEFIAQRFIKNDPTWDVPGVNYMVRQPLASGDGIFIDLYTPEYSRDLEPLRFAYRDNMYLQLCNNIRKYKGVRAAPASSNARGIEMNTDFTQWNAVGPTFIDDQYDVSHRSHTSFGSDFNYTNTSGRNDIIESKVSYDKCYAYFYVKTASNLSTYSSARWMNLLINTDANYSTGWNGYDCIVNQTVNSASSTTIKKHMGGGFNWGNAVNVEYQYSGNQLHVRVPISELGIDPSNAFALDFKWVDNSIASGDIIDVYVDGDAAPNNRFNYRFNAPGLPPVTDAWNFSSNLEGWTNGNNVTTNVTSGVCTISITGNDPNVYSPDVLNLDASRYSHLVIGLQNQTTDNAAQIYWTTNAQPTFDEPKSIIFTIQPNATAQRQYVLDLSSDPDWAGIIRRLRFDPANTVNTGSCALNYIRAVGTYPYGTVNSIPGIVEAENFLSSELLNAQNDQEEGNLGGQYRSCEAPDVEVCGEGGFDVGWTNSGEWMEYMISATQWANYSITARVASMSGGGSFQLWLDGVTIGTTIPVGTTGGWQTYTNVTTSADIAPGTHLLRVQILSGGFNINKFTIAQNFPLGLNEHDAVVTKSNEVEQWNVAPNPTENNFTIELSEKSDSHSCSLYTATGQLKRRMLITGSMMEVDVSEFSPGVYYVQLGSETKKLVIAR